MAEDVSLDLRKAFAFRRPELVDIGVNVSKTVALQPKRHAPTAQEISLLESIYARVVYEGGVTVGGVPIGNDKYVSEEQTR